MLRSLAKLELKRGINNCGFPFKDGGFEVFSSYVNSADGADNLLSRMMSEKNRAKCHQI